MGRPVYVHYYQTAFGLEMFLRRFCAVVLSLALTCLAGCAQHLQLSFLNVSSSFEMSDTCTSHAGSIFGNHNEEITHHLLHVGNTD